MTFALPYTNNDSFNTPFNVYKYTLMTESSHNLGENENLKNKRMARR